MLYIFDLDGTLVAPFGLAPLPGVLQALLRLHDGGHAIAIATNQAGPAWRQATQEPRYPSPAELGLRFKEIAERLPILQRVPWFVALYDERLTLDKAAYDTIAASLKETAHPLEVIPSADPTWRKPSPGMLLAVCRSLDTPPSEACYIGDAETDRAAASAAGIPFVPASPFFASHAPPGRAADNIRQSTS